MKNDAEFYDRQYAELEKDHAKMFDHGWYRHLVRFASGRNQVVAEYLSKESKQFREVVELGCGSGGILEMIDSCCEQYTGFDVSNFNIQKAQTAYPRRQFVLTDLNDALPIPAASVDLVLSISTIEYLFDPEAFVREIQRVLQTGGRLVIHTMNLAFILRRLQLLFGKLPTFSQAAGWQGGVLHNFTVPTFKKLLRDNGFKIEAFYCSGILPGLRRKIFPNLLCGDMIFVCVKQ